MYLCRLLDELEYFVSKLLYTCKKKKDTWNSVKIFRKEIKKKKEKNVSWKFSTVIFLINRFIKDFIK